MSYSVNIREESDYLYIEVAGARTPEMIMAVARDCVAASKKHKRSKILVDIQGAAGRLSTIETYGIVNRPLPALARGLGLKVAILDLEENAGRVQFFETVAVNAGMDLRMFSNPNSALRWLCGTGSDIPTTHTT